MDTFEMTVRKDGEYVDTVQTQADDPESAQEDLLATVVAEYGTQDIEVSGLRRKGQTGV
jgi:hypothetical protein